MAKKRNAAAAADAAAADGDAPHAAAAPTPTRRRRASKKADAAVAAAAGAEEDVEEDSPKAAPKKRGRAAGGKAAKKAAAAADDDDGEAGGEAAAKPKPKRKPAAAKPPAGPVYEASMRPPTFEGAAHRFLSWNVAGMRALMKKDAAALKQLVEAENVDAICLQETKLQEEHVDAIVEQLGLEGWHVAFNCSTAKKGYSGTATLCRHKPLSTRLGIGDVEHDDEGRVVTVELPELWLVNVYTPNSGEGLKRLDYRVGRWDKALAGYLKGLREGPQAKPLVVLGDLNCAAQPIDVYDPKRHNRSAGFTQEERDSFAAEILGGAGLVDAFRAAHPGVVGYTYYSFRGPGGGMRASGRGWRLDYTLVSSDLAPLVHDAFILKDVLGSDHVPLGVVIKRGGGAD